MRFKRIGCYDVTALIGEGGMGQVYQATDTKLNRQVALKILPEAFASDPDRLARFQREAQVLASLNHPGIAAIYGIEEQDDARAREAFDGQPWSDFVNRHTRFSGWGEMLSTAGKEHVATQLFKGLR